MISILAAPASRKCEFIINAVRAWIAQIMPLWPRVLRLCSRQFARRVCAVQPERECALLIQSLLARGHRTHMLTGTKMHAGLRAKFTASKQHAQLLFCDVKLKIYYIY